MTSPLNQGTECAICQDSDVIPIASLAHTQPCGHEFHQRRLDGWFDAIQHQGVRENRFQPKYTHDFVANVGPSIISFHVSLPNENAVCQQDGSSIHNSGVVQDHLPLSLRSTIQQNGLQSTPKRRSICRSIKRIKQPLGHKMRQLHSYRK